MKRLNWTGMGLLALSALCVSPAVAQSAAHKLADLMSPSRSQAKLAEDMGEARAVQNEAAGTMIPAAPPAESASGLSGLATGGGRGKARIDLGREADEDPNVDRPNIFDDPKIRKMLGKDPDFIYSAEGLRDPMLVPWVRQMAIFKELVAEADELIAAEKYAEAKKLYDRLLAFRDDRFMNELLGKVDRLERLIAEKTEIERQSAMNAGLSIDLSEDEPEPELPSWISDSTNGVLVGENGRNPLCMVGEAILHEGDSVPGYSHVKVAKITKKKVTYQIKDVTFEVDIEDKM